jgi:hypothetical protein
MEVVMAGDMPEDTTPPVVETSTGAEALLVTAAEAGAFLIEHPDVIVAFKNALSGGATKQELMDGMRATMLAAAEARLTMVLGPR